MRIAFTAPSGPHERFAPDAFDGQIGKHVPVRIGNESQPATLVAAKVASDGQSVEMTVEVQGGMTA